METSSKTIASALCIRTFYLFPLLWLPLSGSAQVTQAMHQPAAGDIQFRYFIDTATIDEGPNGMGQTWDFSSLQLLPLIDTLTYRMPVAADLSYFPTADLALDQWQPESYVYSAFNYPETEFFELYADSMRHLGYMHPIGADDGPSVMDDPAKLIEYPFTFSNNFLDSLSGEFYGFGVFTYHGFTEVAGMGMGTLILPGGTFTNVVKVVENDVMLSGFIAKPYKRSVYFYSPDYSEPLIVIRNYPGSKVAWGTQDFMLAAEPPSVISGMTVFPNPSAEQATLRFGASHSGMARVNITNLAGQQVSGFDLSFHSGSNEVKLPELPLGLWLLSLQTGEEKPQSAWIFRAIH